MKTHVLNALAALLLCAATAAAQQGTSESAAG